MQSEDRLHALDAVRAWALLVGVFFHAALSFITSYVANLNWVIGDSSQSATLLGFVGTSHLFRMPLFFLIAGFFAHLVYHRKGPGAFAKNRIVRIAVPFFVGISILIPLHGYIWSVGYQKMGKSFPGDAGSFWSNLAQGNMPLTHLWFLYYLLLLYVLIVGTRHVLIERFDANRRFRTWADMLFKRAVEQRWAPVLVSVPVALAATLGTDWAGGGMPTPDRSLWPELIPMAGYGAAFAAGWMLHRNGDLLQLLGQRTRVLWYYAMAASVAAVACGSVIGLKPDFLPWLMRPLSTLVSTSLTWYVDFALIGLALRKCSAPSARTRYIADASYWIYIAHLPVVAALQVWVAHWNLHWTIKYSLIMAIAFVVLFASYEWFVRYTFIGAILNGRKVRGKGRSDSPLATTPIRG